MTEEQLRMARHLKSITIISGARENIARYIHAHLQDLDQILRPEGAADLYASRSAVNYAGEATADALFQALQTALKILESPNYFRIFIHSRTDCKVSREVLAQLETDIACHIADADSFPSLIGITGSSASGRTALMNRLQEQGFRTFDCEEIYQTLLHSNSAMIEKFYEVEPAMFADYECDWAKLDLDCLHRIIRYDPPIGRFLTKVIHFNVRMEIVKLLASGSGPAAIEGSAFYMSKLDKICSITAAVTDRDDDRSLQQFDHILTDDASMDAFATKCLAFLL